MQNKKKPYCRLNPWHWLMAIFSNSRKADYTATAKKYYPTSLPANQRIRYWIRNPAHDFTAYIIGFDGDPRYRTVRGNPDTVLQEGGTWAVRRWRWLLLPFVSYQHHFKCYLGWRPDGTFGGKFRFKLRA